MTRTTYAATVADITSSHLTGATGNVTAAQVAPITDAAWDMVQANATTEEAARAALIAGAAELARTVSALMHRA